MVDSTRVVALYPPIIPVRIAATAVTVITTSPAVPMISFATKKVGSDSTPLKVSSTEIYSCQEE